MRFIFALLLCLSTYGLSQDIELTTQNTVVLRGPIVSSSASKFIADFHRLEHQDEIKIIYVYIKSPGGSIFAGDYIANIMKSSKKKVVSIVDFAASMAFHVSHFAQQRLILPSGTLMQHHASGQPGRGEFPNVDKGWDWIKRKVERMNLLDAEACKRTSLAQFKKNIDRDWWLLANEALEAGCADAVVRRIICSASLSNMTTREVVELPGISAEVTWSGCPLEPYPRNVRVLNVTDLLLTSQQKKILEEYLLLITNPLQYHTLRGEFDLGRFNDESR